MKHGVVAEISNERGGYWPTVARVLGGKIVCVYSGERMGHVCPFGVVQATEFDETTHTWSPPWTVFNTPLDDRDAGLTAWNNVAVLSTFNNTREFQRTRHSLAGQPEKLRLAMQRVDEVTNEQEREFYGSTLCFSKDGKTFENPVKMPITAPHGPIALSSGELFFVGRAFGYEENGFVSPLGKDLLDGIYATLSADGRAWSAPVLLAVGEEMRSTHWFCEPHAVECADGSILVVIRAHRKDNSQMSLAVSRSTDGGKSFSPIRPIGFGATAEPWRGEGPAHLLRLANGDVLLSYGYRAEPYGIRARISGDNGDTWGEEIVLRDDGESWDLGYPASVQLSSGSVLTVYYIKPTGSSVARIEYTIWEL